jgi:hypothetical protein
MNCKNCNTALLWLAGALLAASIVFPNGLKLGKPAAPVAPVAEHATDAEIVRVLAEATAADKANVNGIYTALATILRRDIAKPPMRITTTEKWADLQANTLQLAIEQVGKYPGLDKAIEAVFLAKVGTDDVVQGSPETHAKLIDACETIASSAR